MANQTTVLINTNQTSVNYPQVQPVVVQGSVNVAANISVNPQTQATQVTVNQNLTSGINTELLEGATLAQTIANINFLFLNPDGSVGSINGGTLINLLYTAGSGIVISPQGVVSLASVAEAPPFLVTQTQAILTTESGEELLVDNGQGSLITVGQTTTSGGDGGLPPSDKPYLIDPVTGDYLIDPVTGAYVTAP